MGIGSACVFVCAIRYVSARKPYECAFMCVGARVGALTRDRQARIY